MIKLLLNSSLLKTIVILFNLLIPAVVIRSYSAYDFGIYSYLLVYAIVVSILQNGVTASFRNIISNLENKEILSCLLFTIKRVTFPTLTILFISGVFVSLLLGVDTIYGKIAIFVSVSLINIFYPLVASYFDARGKTVKFVLYEIIFSVLSLALIYILGLFKVNILFVCIITANYRGVYAVFLLVYKYIGTSSRYSDMYNKNKKYVIFCFEDILFVSIQLINVINSLLFMNMLAGYYGVISFGIFALYYRFVSFPQQIVGFSASLIWIRFRQIYFDNKNMSREFLKNLLFVFALLLISWFFIVHFLMETIIRIYSSKILIYPGDLILLNIMICLVLVKDFTSIILNAINVYKAQIILNFFLLFINLLFWKFNYLPQFDTVYLVILSVLTLICILVNSFFIKNKVFR
ncbi:TPA: polysaccharide biosynthesis protein [Salmonella enterica]|uniref:O-antigen flippase n=4 Tax=Salmonella enterica TaxID=28901 RepID=U3GJZ2_SALER|nr:polysaccharide biosynthesis protein [Salmonella enterica]AZT07416.1 polysaccharide biosynthesis protein [Salmonella enterica subsp. enterica serovar 43:a:1,7]EAW1728171.1 polysaccharide biosynthesis protein [Salmonella enterica subsp. enterica]EBG3172616.1 polysaccharide biosynthesis protein [Salmonella enterica subsp. enterica serovar Thetford]EBG5200808.1 polysaccharide biosynthesis protein [Salmonella enterica subsp. enterica serovar Kingabwa]EBQ6007617.1 polysaccharide biosynthesis prot